MKTTFLILFTLILIPITTSFAEKSECDINDEQLVRAVLNEDEVIQKFLELHPSAEFVHNPTHDEQENLWATSEFSQNGISLGIIISTYDENGGCYWIRGYSVSYDMPPTGVGVSLSRTQTFESDQKNEAIQAIIGTTSPPEQIKNGVPITEIKCREGLVPTFKRDRMTPACVTETTWNELILRGWSPLRLGMPAETNILITYDAQSVYPMRIAQDFNSEFLMDNTIYWVNNDVVSHSIIAGDNSWNVGPIESGGVGAITFNQTGIYPYHIKENPNAEGKLVFEHTEPYFEPQQLDIANIEGRYIHLNPVDRCATISLELMSPDELGQTKSGTKDVVFLELDEKDLEEMPILDELIRATHYLEFPANDYSHAEMGLRELVDYELFIMEKAIEKYGDTQEDYFVKLDFDLDERLADPKKQGFSNEFIAPQIVYENKVYVLSHTIFWVSDEHETQSMSVHLKENLDEEKKVINLNDKDMESIPKIRDAIKRIGTELESVVAFKGVPENPDWNNYREWYAKKSAEQFDTDNVYVRGFVYENEHYDLGFPIC